jgi:hypothetical protein
MVSIPLRLLKGLLPTFDHDAPHPHDPDPNGPPSQDQKEHASSPPRNLECRQVQRLDQQYGA